MALEWTAELNTGISVIDQQHMRLIDYINELEHARDGGDRAKVGSVLNELVDYTLSHFAFEESLLEEAGYRFIGPHKKVHSLFVRRIDEYKQRFEAGEDVAEEIHQLLSSWIVNHIKRDDADYVQAVQPEIKAVAKDESSGGWLSRSMKRFFGG